MKDKLAYLVYNSRGTPIFKNIKDFADNIVELLRF